MEARPVAEFDERKFRWLWSPFFPRGTVTSLFGDGGIGKSTVIIDMAARVTTGRPMPNETKGARGTVLFMSAEDDIETTVKPRLRAAGADMTRVFVLGYDDPDDPKNFDPVDNLTSHLDELEEIIVAQGNVRLLAIDPLADFAGDLNLDKNQDVRKLLRPLIRLARRHQVAIVIIFHINKNQEQNAKHRGMGSLAMRNVPRSSVLLACDPASPVTRRVLVQTKTNNAPSDCSALGFSIVQGRGDQAIHIEWDAEMRDADPDELLSKKAAKESQREKAVKFLHEQLADGPVASDTLREAAKLQGLSWRTVNRVKEEAGAISRKNDDGITWSWKLKKETLMLVRDGKFGKRWLH